MSNDLLKMHLSAVYERADKQLSQKGGSKKSKNARTVEKSSSRLVKKTKRVKTASNFLGMI